MNKSCENLFMIDYLCWIRFGITYKGCGNIAHAGFNVGGKMKPVSRRDMLKAGLLVPAVAAAHGLGPISATAIQAAQKEPASLPIGQATDSVKPGAGRERLLLDFGWRFHFGNANDPARETNRRASHPNSRCFLLRKFRRRYSKSLHTIPDLALLSGRRVWERASHSPRITTWIQTPPYA